MNKLFSILNTIQNFILIFRNEIGFKKKKRLFLTYLNLKFTYSVSRLLKLKNNKKNIFGFKIIFFDYLSLIYLFEEIFIKKEYSFIANHNKPFIIDCGSNIGMSILFFKYLYPNCRIIGFEPDKETFGVLKENVELNKLKDVTLYNAAVYDSSGQIKFYYDKNQRGSLHMSIKKERLPKNFQSVHSVLLSEHIKEKIDFIKIDVEGAEDAVIKELSKQDKLKFFKELVIEYHHHINPKKNKLSNILNILEKNAFGYQVSAPLKPPFDREKFQDILIYAYQK